MLAFANMLARVPVCADCARGPGTLKIAFQTRSPAGTTSTWILASLRSGLCTAWGSTVACTASALAVAVRVRASGASDASKDCRISKQRSGHAVPIELNLRLHAGPFRGASHRPALCGCMQAGLCLRQRLSAAPTAATALETLFSVADYACCEAGAVHLGADGAESAGGGGVGLFACCKGSSGNAR